MIKKPIGHFNKLFDFTCPFCLRIDESKSCDTNDHSYDGEMLVLRHKRYSCIVEKNNTLMIRIYYPQYQEVELLYSGYIDSSDKDNLVKNMVNTLDSYLNNMVFL